MAKQLRGRNGVVINGRHHHKPVVSALSGNWHGNDDNG
jgi:hypothetical protein